MAQASASENISQRVSGNLKQRSNQFHPVLSHQVRLLLVVRVCIGVSCAYLVDESEIRLHLVGGRERDEKASFLFAHKCPCVRNLARCKQGITRAEFEAVWPDLDDIAAFNYIEVFLLVVMEMSRRPALLMITLLHYKQISP